jgi:ELAV like protein 2/3/4
MDLCSSNSSSLSSDSISNTLSSSSSLSSNTNNSNLDTTSKTNLIVNYVPQTMVKDEFETLFASIGEIQCCTLVMDKLSPYNNNNPQQNLGYGFVNYVRGYDASEAIRLLNGLRLENKTLKVSYARPSSGTIKGANLFVCNMPKTWSSDDMTRMFSSCGLVITSRVLYHKLKSGVRDSGSGSGSDSGESKGVGFVRFDRREEVWDFKFLSKFCKTCQGLVKNIKIWKSALFRYTCCVRSYLYFCYLKERLFCV